MPIRAGARQVALVMNLRDVGCSALTVCSPPGAGAASDGPGWSMVAAYQTASHSSGPRLPTPARIRGPGPCFHDRSHVGNVLSARQRDLDHGGPQVA